MTDFPEIPLDPAIVDLLDAIDLSEFHRTLPQCGKLLRRARALGFVRDRRTRDPQGNVRLGGLPCLTIEGEAALRKARRA